MYNEKLSKLINQVCHAWEEQQAEHEAKMRSLANSIVAEHETERFNIQKSFKNALTSKNNEVNALLSECKKLKALVTHIHNENKELQKKLSNANRTIELLRQGLPSDENSLTRKTLSEDSSFNTNDDSLAVGDFYGNSDDLPVGSHGQIPNWNVPQQNRQQAHLFSRDRQSPDVDSSFGYGQGGYFPGPEPDGRSSAPPPPPSGGGGIGGLFTSSTSGQHLPTRQGPAHGLVYGGRYVLDGPDEHPGGMYQREDFRLDRAGSYDPRLEKDSEEFRQSTGFPDDRHLSESTLQHQHAQGPKRLSPAASPFMPGGQSPISRHVGAPFFPPSVPTLSAKSGPIPLKADAPPPPGFETFLSERDQIYRPNEANYSQSSSLGSISMSDPPPPSLSMPLSVPGPEQSFPESSTEDQSTNEAANLLNQMRLQSKSSKLAAKPLASPQVSPAQPTFNSADSL